MHAGAEDHLVRGAIPRGCCRARCATRSRSAGCGGSCPPPTTSPGCPTSRIRARRRAPPAHGRSHRDAGGLPVRPARGRGIPDDDRSREAAEVLLEAVRDADLPPASPTTRSPCCSRGDAAGAESLVLSRLVEAIAVHDADQDPPRPLSLSVGSRLYEPGRPRASRRSSRPRDAACASAWRADPSDRPPAANTPRRARCGTLAGRCPWQRTMLPARSLADGND